EVDAVDVARAALRAGAALAAAYRVAGRVRWVAHDLDAGLPTSCRGPYDVVVCQRFRDPALYPALAGVLAPGGLLAVTVLSEVGGSAGPFRAPAGELRAAFGAVEGLTVLAETEGGGEARLVARRTS
ncbi:MAG TPA: SAM-dependent methyltransferase, partial [Pseudonocardia sp.]|nr:SAM-dependent methyltransferase [Pseudonocardia sp.]